MSSGCRPKQHVNISSVFLSRFKGRTNLVGKEGQQGIVEQPLVPIQKLPSHDVSPVGSCLISKTRLQPFVTMEPSQPIYTIEHEDAATLLSHKQKPRRPTGGPQRPLMRCRRLKHAPENDSDQDDCCCGVNSRSLFLPTPETDSQKRRSPVPLLGILPKRKIRLPPICMAPEFPRQSFNRLLLRRRGEPTEFVRAKPRYDDIVSHGEHRGRQKEKGKTNLTMGSEQPTSRYKGLEKRQAEASISNGATRETTAARGLAVPRRYPMLYKVLQELNLGEEDDDDNTKILLL